MTAQQHILDEQRRLRPDATGEFLWLLSGITLATKIVADAVRRAGWRPTVAPDPRRNTDQPTPTGSLADGQSD